MFILKGGFGLRRTVSKRESLKSQRDMYQKAEDKVIPMTIDEKEVSRRKKAIDSALKDYGEIIHHIKIIAIEKPETPSCCLDHEIGHWLKKKGYEVLDVKDVEVES